MDTQTLPHCAEAAATVEKWGIFEASFAGPSDGNPFPTSPSTPSFATRRREVRVPGFYDGDGTYRVRFMPDTEGDWSLRDPLERRRRSTARPARFDGRPRRRPATTARCASATASISPTPTARRTSRSARPATPGRTSRSAMQAETLETLTRTRFNKIRMGVFPKDYPYNNNEPLHPTSTSRRRRQARLRPAQPRGLPALRDAGRRRSRELGIEADIIIFHPYDRWGYCRHDGGAGLPLRRLPRRAARGLSQRLVVARQRVRLPARHQADGAVGPLLPHPRGERPLPAPEVDPQRRPDDELRPPQALGQPRLHPELGREAHPGVARRLRQAGRQRRARVRGRHHPVLGQHHRRRSWSTASG